MSPSVWKLALELDSGGGITAGCHENLCRAIGRGADLRVFTHFLYEEHVTPFQADPALVPADGVVEESIDFRQTFLINNNHVAGVVTTRQAMNPLIGYNGNTPLLSFFLYNMTRHQACANLVLDDSPRSDRPGHRKVIASHSAMAKMSDIEVFDCDTSGPSRNFIYDMEVYRFWVRDDWEEVFAHDPDGEPITGSWQRLTEAHRNGQEIKLGIRDLCSDLGDGPGHEVFTPLGPGFNHQGRCVYDSQSHPMVRVISAIPLQYRSQAWDVTWLIARTDGTADLRSLNPYTRRFRDWHSRFGFRWFAR